MDELIFNTIQQFSKEFPEKLALTDGTTQITYKDLFLRLTIKPVKSQLNYVYLENKIDSVVNYLQLRSSGSVVMIAQKNMNLENQQHLLNEIYESIPLNRFKIPGEISLSSGSTGQPKIVYLSHKSQIYVAEDINSLILDGASLDEIIVLPIFHSSGLGRLRAAFLRGATIYLASSPIRPKQLLSFIDSAHEFSIALTPSAWNYLRKFFGEDFKEVFCKAKVIEFGSSPILEKELLDIQCYAPSNSKVVSHYGLTECSRSFLVNLATSTFPTSLGKTLGNTKYRISPTGELEISSTHSAVWVHDVVSGLTVTEYPHWVRTGDLVSETNTEIYFQGRTFLQINVGGRKVSSSRILQVAQQFGILNEMVIVPIHDSILGERPCLIIEAEHPFDTSSLGDYLRQSLELFELPSRISFTPRLPRVSTGKIDFSRLIEEIG